MFHILCLGLDDSEDASARAYIVNRPQTHKCCYAISHISHDNDEPDLVSGCDARRIPEIKSSLLFRARMRVGLFYEAFASDYGVLRFLMDEVFESCL